MFRSLTRATVLLAGAAVMAILPTEPAVANIAGGGADVFALMRLMPGLMATGTGASQAFVLTSTFQQGFFTATNTSMLVTATCVVAPQFQLNGSGDSTGPETLQSGAGTITFNLWSSTLCLNSGTMAFPSGLSGTYVRFGSHMILTVSGTIVIDGPFGFVEAPLSLIGNIDLVPTNFPTDGNGVTRPITQMEAWGVLREGTIRA